MFLQSSYLTFFLDYSTCPTNTGLSSCALAHSVFPTSPLLLHTLPILQNSAQMPASLKPSLKTPARKDLPLQLGPPTLHISKPPCYDTHLSCSVWRNKMAYWWCQYATHGWMGGRMHGWGHGWKVYELLSGQTATFFRVMRHPHTWVSASCSYIYLFHVYSTAYMSCLSSHNLFLISGRGIGNI